MSKQIALTQGKVTLVDDLDYERLNQWKWYANKQHNTWYAVRGIRDYGKVTMIRMHREILHTPVGMDTDHKDGDGLNNRRNNLRCATTAQNHQNGRSRKGTSRFKGVCRNRRAGKWKAYIHAEGRTVHLGCFDSETDAAKAYDNAAQRYFGDFACTNF